MPSYDGWKTTPPTEALEADCPSCGVEGFEGYECSECGTLIPVPSEAADRDRDAEGKYDRD